MRKTVLTAAILIAAPATADTLTYDSYQVFGDPITITAPVTINTTAGLTVLYEQGRVVGVAFCADIFDRLQTAGIYNIVPLSPRPAAVPASADLYPMAVLAIDGFNLSGSLFATLRAGLPTQLWDDIFAAFQIDIWRLEYPDFSYSSAFDGTVNNWLTTAWNMANTGDVNWRASGFLIGAGNQDLIEGVPEPSTWAMLLVGMAAFWYLGGVRRSAE